MVTLNLGWELVEFRWELHLILDKVFMPEAIDDCTVRAPVSTILQHESPNSGHLRRFLCPVHHATPAISILTPDAPNAPGPVRTLSSSQ